MRLTHVALFTPHFVCIDREDHGRYHVFTEGMDISADPHDHAEWGFWSEVIKGGYVEEIFDLQNPEKREIVERREGDRFRVETDHVHRMIGMIGPICVTHVAPDVHSGAPHANAYQFRDDGVFIRPVFGGEWRRFE